MKGVAFVFASLFFSVSAYAMTSYPLQIGLGYEACRPNRDGLKTCEGLSPQTKEVVIQLQPSAEAGGDYGYFFQKGSLGKLGFEASVQVAHFDHPNSDDMLTLKVVTWPLANPSERYEVTTEIFASEPTKLNRAYVTGHAIGTEDDFVNIILGIRPTQKNRNR